MHKPLFLDCFLDAIKQNFLGEISFFNSISIPIIFHIFHLSLKVLLFFNLTF